MGGLILLCRRQPQPGGGADAALLERVADRLRPDVLSPQAPLLQRREWLTLLVAAPAPGMPQADTAVCLGALVSPGHGWSRTGGAPPDGSYALVRHDDQRVELVTDALASRTLWYAHTPDLFLASTSQRALVTLLGGFEPDPAAVVWMASSGTLGPAASWDRRLRRLEGWTTLTLHRDSWRLTADTRPVEFAPGRFTDQELVGEFRQAILSSCAELDVDIDRWLLPLSGGMDSRGLLLSFLAAGRRPACVTWGLRASLARPDNDAFIAQQLARHTRVGHRYLATDHTTEPVRRVLTRFLKAGEGRSEDFAGYTDGLEVWRLLHDEGVAGVIRGDEPGWGYRHYHSEGYARRRVHLTVLSDYAPGHLVRRLGLEELPVPAPLAIRPGESLTTYRDRIYDAFNLPAFFAALNDIKTPFVEIANPFLTRRVVAAVRALPDRLRDGRAAFAGIVASMSPDIPYAGHGAPADPEEYLGRPELLQELAAELGSSGAAAIVEQRALDEVVAALTRPTGSDRSRRLQLLVRRVVPHELGRRLRPDPPVLLSSRQLAFRLYVASRMYAILAEDAAAGLRSPETARAGSG